MVRLIGVGDNTVDTYVHTRTQYPGGNAINVAVLAKRYGHDEAAYLGWLGQDERGQMILNALAAEGVDTSHCRSVQEKPTAYSTVTLVNGDRVFGASDHGACSLLYLEPADFDYIRTYDVVHTSAFSHIEKQLPELKKASRILSFDLSQRHDQRYLANVLPNVDVAFISLSDVAEDQQDTLLRRMHTMGPRLVVATRGKQGSWVFDGSRIYHQGIIPVEAVDTLGAGDAFAAAFLVEITNGTKIPLAMELAANFAAQNCTHFGAFGYGESY